MKILLVEDDEALVAVLTRNLVAQHYVVDHVRDGEKGWTYCTTFEYDLIVLDIVLPKLDGINLCRRLRAKGYSMPIMLLTTQDNSTAKVQGLDAGADDYVVKPFDQAELLARLRALLRRGANHPFPWLAWGDLLLNPSTYEVSYNGQMLTLTTKEYDLLEILLRDSQHVFSSDELIDRLWSSEEFPSEATVRSHIRRVRHKLTAVGAPPDFIATLHGRGYYLKAAEAEAAIGDNQPSPPSNLAASACPTAALTRPTHAAQPQDAASPSADEQQQYVKFLNETWTTTQPKSLAQMAILVQMVSDLHHNRLTAYQQTEAQQVAHTLVGTLGVFGLTKTTHLARQLEHWLKSSEPLQPQHAPLLTTLVTALQQEIQTTTQITLPQITAQPAPRFVLVSSDATFNQALRVVALSWGMQMANVPSSTAIAKLSELQPNVVVLHWPAVANQSAAAATRLRQQQLDSLQSLARHDPALPIMVVSDRGDLADRLAVLQRGGKLFLETPTAPESVIAAVASLLESEAPAAKVMVVDHDQTWLTTLPTLLKPWGFKVTTLDEPQHFWTVLKAVNPDALILAVNLPEINGFELCQLLRSDPQWQRVPILFLSALTDVASQNQAFTVGADDYLCKPVMGVELANRLLHRLRRVRAWAR
jgi:DNA-binding response OmpR family regulator